MRRMFVVSSFLLLFAGLVRAQDTLPVSSATVFADTSKIGSVSDRSSFFLHETDDYNRALMKALLLSPEDFLHKGNNPLLPDYDFSTTSKNYGSYGSGMPLSKYYKPHQINMNFQDDSWAGTVGRIIGVLSWTILGHQMLNPEPNPNLRNEPPPQQAPKGNPRPMR